MRGARKTKASATTTSTRTKVTKAKTSKSKKTKVKSRAAAKQTPEDRERVQNIVQAIMDDRRLTLKEIAKIIDSPTEDVLRILMDECEFRQMHGQWVPNSIHPMEKYKRVDVCTQLLTQLKRDRIGFLCRFVTVDQFWVYHDYAQVTEQAESDTSPSKKAKTTTQTDDNVKKVRVIVFWNALGVILVDYMKKNQKLTAEYYAKLLKRLSEEIKTKRPLIGKRKVLLQQNDTPLEQSMIAGSTAYRCNFEEIPHSIYWPDLAPTSYHLIPNLETAFSGRRFSSDKAVIDAVNTYFESLDEFSFKQGITELEQRWNKCIQAKGDYFE